jgi:hypothetical protein
VRSTSLPTFGPLLAFVCIACQPLIAHAHEGHGAHSHAPAVAATPLTSAQESGADVETAFENDDPSADAVTGSGKFKFRYHADLSKLPANIAAGIKNAHGGFAKTPSGDVYFGLNGIGLIKLSADLQTKTLVSNSESLLMGGLHNCTHVDRDGGFLVLPDNQTGRVLMVRTDGTEVKTLGRPPFLPDGNYAPTDAQVADDDKLYVCDGYGSSKSVFTIDLERREYEAMKFGGKTGEGQQPGKFSTNHGLTFDETDGTLMVADRERQWVQKLTTEGKFIEGYQTDQANPCDVDFVEFDGERLMVVGCLSSPENGVVKILQDGKVVSTLKPLKDLGLDQFKHIHNAIGIVVDNRLFVLCYGWNPGCYAVLEHIAE